MDQPKPDESTPAARTEPACQALLPRIAAGDASAIEACVEHYGALIWSIAKKYCPKREDAEEAVQDAFTAIWKSAARFDAKLGSEAAFVITLAKRRAIDRQRQRSREPAMKSLSKDTDNNVIDPPAQSRAPADSAELREEARLAKHALSTLTPEVRNALTHAVESGLSHSEIAEKLDLPLGTVKTRIRQGLLRMREVLSTTRGQHLADSPAKANAEVSDA